MSYLCGKSIINIIIMKQFLLLLLLSVPFVLSSQSKSNNEDIKIAFDTEVNGCRVIATTGRVLVSLEDAHGAVLSRRSPLMVSLMYRCNDNRYSIRFSCADGETSELFLRAPQPIVLTLKDGQVLTFETADDFGFVEIDKNTHIKNPVHSSNTKYFSFCVTREQINNLTQSEIVNVRLSPDGKEKVEFNIDNNLLSDVLNQQLKVIDHQMANPMPVDNGIPVQTTR